MRRRICIALSGLALSTASCSTPAAEEQATATAPSEQASAPVSAPTASAAPPAVVDRSPITGSLAKERLILTATKLDTSRLEDRLTMWLTDERALNLHALRGAMLVSYAGVVAELKDHKLAIGYALFPEEAYTVLSMAGSWPDRVEARVYFDSWKSPGYQRSPPVKETKLHSYVNGKLSGMGSDDAPLKMAGWKNKSALSLVKGELSVYGEGTPPRQQPPRDGARCKVAEIAAEELDALPTGEAFLLGRHCGEGAYAVEIFAPDGTSKIEELPDPPSKVKRGFVSAGTEKRAYVVLSTGEAVYFATWDGMAMRRLLFEASGDVASVWTTADGTLFFILLQKGKAELWRVLPSGEAKRSGVFAPSPGAQVWAADADTAYVPSFTSVLSTKPGLEFTGYAKKDDDAEKGPDSAAGYRRTGLPPYSDDCKTPFVWLFDVADSSGKEFTFPNTRGALASFPKLDEIKLVEIALGTRARKLGVVVPSKVVGEEVIAHVKKHMKDEDPAMACYAPPADARTIAFK